MNRIPHIALFACTLALAACATKTPPPPTTQTTVQSGPDSVSRTTVTTVTAVVQDVDLKDRLVALKRADGSIITLAVDPSVQNLPQVKKGQKIVVQFRSSMAVRVVKPGDEQDFADEATTTDVQRAAPGQLPAGAVTQTATVVVTVDAINRQPPSLTVRGPNGGQTDLPVQDPANLDKVKVGDQLEVTITEAVAVAVEPAKK